MVYTLQTISRRHVLCCILFAVFFTLMTCPQPAAAAPERYSLSHRPADTPTCQLIYGSGGNTALDVSQVADPGLQATLRSYNLECNPAGADICALTQANGGITLDLSNLPSSSSYIINGLTNPKYNLNCQGSGSRVLLRFFFPSNIPPNGRGSCSLTWGTSGVTLNFDSSVTDASLKNTLQNNYSLNCSNTKNQPTACSLILGGNGDTLLDVENLRSSSSWLYAKLEGHYTLHCGASYSAPSVTGFAETVTPTFSFCDGGTDQNEGNYYSVHLGPNPICDHVTWMMGNNEKGKSCAFSMNWYGGDTWVMDFYTNNGGLNYRATTQSINGPLTNVSESDVEQIGVEMPLSPGYITNGTIDVAPITVTNCQ